MSKRPVREYWAGMVGAGQPHNLTYKPPVPSVFEYRGGIEGEVISTHATMDEARQEADRLNAELAISQHSGD